MKTLCKTVSLGIVYNMASDCLLQGVSGDSALLMTSHGEYHLKPAGSALAPQNVATIRGTVSLNDPNGLLK